MISAIVYKEWLKIRWAFIAMLAVNLLVVLNIYLDVSNYLKVYSANELLGMLIFNQAVYYSDIQFLPLLSGLLLGVFQFFPEINQKRLKLSFHLPMKESRNLFYKASAGIVSLLLIYLADVISLLVISTHFFPKELFISMVITMVPWLIAGAAAYFWVVIVFVEPNWMKRIILTVAGTGFLFFFFAGEGYSKYEYSWWMFAVAAVLFSSAIYISAYDFKRGIS